MQFITLLRFHVFDNTHIAFMFERIANSLRSVELLCGLNIQSNKERLDYFGRDAIRVRFEVVAACLTMDKSYRDD